MIHISDEERDRILTIARGMGPFVHRDDIVRQLDPCLLPVRAWGRNKARTGGYYLQRAVSITLNEHPEEFVQRTVTARSRVWRKVGV